MRGSAIHVLIFLLGFVTLPLVTWLNYEVHWKADSSIDLKPRRVDKTSEAKESNSTTQPATDKECARRRWLLKRAVMDYSQKFGPMKTLNIFELIGKGYLKQMPDCPEAGAFSLKWEGKEAEISCSKHGNTVR